MKKHLLVALGGTISPLTEFQFVLPYFRVHSQMARSFTEQRRCEMSTEKDLQDAHNDGQKDGAEGNYEGDLFHSRSPEEREAYNKGYENGRDNPADDDES